MSPKLVVAIGCALLAAGAGMQAGAAPTPAAVPSGPPDGKVLYEYWCATCHGAGRYERGYLPGTQSLMVKYKGAVPAVLTERDNLVPEFTRYVIRNGIEGMPPFRKTEISDAEMEAIAAYLAPEPREAR